MNFLTCVLIVYFLIITLAGVLILRQGMSRHPGQSLIPPLLIFVATLLALALVTVIGLRLWGYGSVEYVLVQLMLLILYRWFEMRCRAALASYFKLLLPG